MKTADEITAAKNAWLIWKKITDLETLLWNLYYDEFLGFDEDERMVSSIEAS